MAEQTLYVPANPNVTLLRQAGILIGIAAAVAIGVAVVLWSQTPNYSLLYSSLSDRDLSQVMDALHNANIDYKVQNSSGAILVPSSKVYDARMKLAAAGLPKSASMGFETLEKDQGFGSSQLSETVRFQHALEEELAKSVSRLANVRTARVHLAIPKQSVFARDHHDPSASVLVDLYPGRTLDDGQVAAISHLVAASVPNLSEGEVTVVDQQGQLLTAPDGPENMQVALARYDYTRKLEDNYSKRIEDILTPLVGADGVKAQVSAEVDFTDTEQTSESYNPDQQAMRSEQTMEERRVGDAGAGGIPGALSNEPPAGGSAPETTAASANGPNSNGGNTKGGASAQGQNANAQGGGATATKQTAQMPESTRKQETRNFEVDKTISHTRMPVGTVHRLSVAVLVNNKTVVDDSGKTTQKPLSADEIARITALVKEAVGFNAARGDTVNVTNADFTKPPEIQPLPEPPIWKQPWVWDIAKQVAGGLFALLVAFGIIRPAIKSLMKREAASSTGQVAVNADGTLALPPGASGMQAALPGPNQAAGQISAPSMNEMERVKQFAAQDPKLAAQVVKSWVNQE
jgi:flagellar M-ring protein FliF